jgi:hypothetical protein
MPLIELLQEVVQIHDSLDVGQERSLKDKLDWAIRDLRQQRNIRIGGGLLSHELVGDFVA